METDRAERLPGGSRAIGPIGSLARLLLGVGLIVATVTRRAGDGAQLTDVLLGLVVVPAILLGWQFARRLWTTSTLDATGTIGFVLNAAIASALFATANTREPAMLFYGVSMLLIAAGRGYAGCEVLAISNWILRRDDQVGCVVFSPVDAIERSVAHPGQ